MNNAPTVIVDARTSQNSESGDPPSALARGALPGARIEREREARKRRRTRMHHARQALLGAVILGAAALTLYSLRPRPLPVDVAQVTRGPLSVVIEETGTTRIKDRYVVYAPVTGELARVALEAGDPVRDGDALIEIAPASSALLDSRSREAAEARASAALQALGQARAQYERALAARQLAAQQLERERALARSGSLPAETLERTEFADRMRQGELVSAEFARKLAAEELRVARAAVGHDQPSAQRHLAVRAPASGVVLRVLQQSAGLVQAGTPLLELGDPRALEVVVDLLTTDAVHIQPGTPVAIVGWGQERALSGRVHRIEPSAFTRLSALGVEEQRVNVIVTPDETAPDWTVLGDGYRIEARLILWEASDVVQVPQGALFRRGSGWATFVIDDGAAHLVPVRIGHRGEQNVEILSGLAPGSRVAVHPGDRIQDGVSVQPR